MNSRKWITSVLAAVTATAVSALVSPPQASAAGVVVRSQLSQRCMEVTGESKMPRAVVQMYNCRGAPHQTWNMEQVGSTAFWRIRNAHSNMCLNVEGGSMADRARVIQYPCGGSGTRNDQWVLSLHPVRKEGRDWYFIINVNSGRCLNVKGGNPNNGTDLIQYKCSGTTNDLWSW